MCGHCFRLAISEYSSTFSPLAFCFSFEFYYDTYNAHKSVFITSQSCGMWHPVFLYRNTNILEQCATPILTGYKLTYFILKWEVANSYKMFVTLHQATWCHNPKDCNLTNVTKSEISQTSRYFVGDTAVGKSTYMNTHNQILPFKLLYYWLINYRTPHTRNLKIWNYLSL